MTNNDGINLVTTHTCLLCDKQATHVNRYTWTYLCFVHAQERANNVPHPKNQMELLPTVKYEKQ